MTASNGGSEITALSNAKKATVSNGLIALCCQQIGEANYRLAVRCLQLPQSQACPCRLVDGRRGFFDPFPETEQWSPQNDHALAGYQEHVQQ